MFAWKALWLLYAANAAAMVYGVYGGRGWRRVLRAAALLNAAVLALALIVDTLRKIGVL